MFSHVVIGSDDLVAAKSFYNAALGALGVAPGEFDARGRLVFIQDGARFLVTTPIDGAPATAANGGTIGFVAPSADAVRAWHDAGVAHGGTTCEDPPGPRQRADGRHIFAAYLRDPDGNKLCAVYRIG